MLFAGFVTLVLIEWIGVAAMVPALRAARVSTLLAYALLAMALLRPGLVDTLRERQTQLLVLFLIFTTASVTWAIVTTSAFNSIRPFVDYIGFYLVGVTVMDRRSRAVYFSLGAVLTIFVLVARNADKLTTTVRQGAFRAGYFLGDGNDFAWGLVVLMPLALYLVIERHNIMLRLIGVVGLMAALAGIVGTQSRGGTLAIAAATAYYAFLVSRRRVLAIGLVFLVVAAAAALAPAQYLSRMQSVSDYQSDNSARSRLQAWGAATRMAVDYPLGVGAGNFNSAYGRHYMPPEEQSQIVWASGRWLSAHSVYFKVLGEYGFLGVILLLSIIALNFRQNARSARQLAERAVASDRPLPPDVVSDRWPFVINMSLIGYAVAAIFLGGLAYPHLFLISALTVGARRQAVRAVLSNDSPPCPPERSPIASGVSRIRAVSRPARSVRPPRSVRPTVAR